MPVRSPLRSLVARGADRPGIAGPATVRCWPQAEHVRPGAWCRTGSGRCRRASGQPRAASGRTRCIPSQPVRPCHSRPSRTALGTPGVDPPGLAAASTRSLAVAGGAGAADPARGRLAPQVGRDPAAPGAGRSRDRQTPGRDQRVRQPEQHQRICGRSRDQSPWILLQQSVDLTQRPPVTRTRCGEHVTDGTVVQSRHGTDQAGGDSIQRLIIEAGRRHDRSGRRIVLRRTGGGAARPDSPAALRTCWLTTSISIRSLGWHSRM